MRKPSKSSRERARNAKDPIGAELSQIIAQGSLDGIRAALKRHQPRIWSARIKTFDYTTPDGSNDIAILEQLSCAGVRLWPWAGSILSTGVLKGDPALLAWWRRAAFPIGPSMRFDMYAAVQRCGPACAGDLHAIITERLDTCAGFAAGAALAEAVRSGGWKTAVYLRSIGTRTSTISGVWWTLAPDACDITDSMQHRLAGFDQSSHGELAFLACEPDPVAILGRNADAVFAGTSVGCLRATL